LGDSGGLGLPPRSAAQYPTGIEHMEPEPEPEPELKPEPEPEPELGIAPAPVGLQILRGVSADFMITSQGVSCDV